jgi:hypothetical protein
MWSVELGHACFDVDAVCGRNAILRGQIDRSDPRHPIGYWVIDTTRSAPRTFLALQGLAPLRGTHVGCATSLAALRGILSQCGWPPQRTHGNLWRQPGYCCGLGLPFNDADGLMDGERALASRILLSLTTRLARLRHPPPTTTTPPQVPPGTPRRVRNPVHNRR